MYTTCTYIILTVVQEMFMIKYFCGYFGYEKSMYEYKLNTCKDLLSKITPQVPVANILLSTKIHIYGIETLLAGQV